MSTSPTLAVDGTGLSTNAPARRAPSMMVMWLIFAAVLLANLAVQLPAVADFQKFGFYDEGSWMRLDALVAQGAIPTVDVGYTYGLVPLLLGRGWFALFGRTPWAFIGFLTACNLLAAGGIASILHGTGTSWRRLIAACLLLPLAIIPNNYSLMHPLEMMLIVWALAQQARGRYGMALAFATLAVLTKPSMGYVLGLMLILLGFWTARPRAVAGEPGEARRGGARWWLRRGVEMAVPPLVTAAVVLAGMLYAVGLPATVASVIPIKAAQSYGQMNFGIFHAGRDFWLRGGSAGEMLLHYVFSPATFWIAASLTLWGTGLLALLRLARKSGARPYDALLVLLALLHAAFVFFFYAWAGSWTYYSYLPVLGVVVGVRGRGTGRYLALLVLAGALGQQQRLGDGVVRWQWTVRTADSGGLWVYSDVMDEARKARALAAEHRGLFLVNGTLSTIWPEVQTPSCWFVAPGMLTDAERQAIAAQVARANAIVLYKDYDQRQEMWNWKEFAAQRAEFDVLWESKHFKVLKRRGT